MRDGLHWSAGVRDKIAASKKKGIWMGGPVPLGYQVVERKLVPVPEDAERVRTIMRRYLEVRNVPALIEVLRAEGVVTKVQQRVSGPHRGGIPFARGSLFHLLENPIYRGKIVHKGKVYDGEYALRRLAKMSDAGSLRALFERAKGLSDRLEQKDLSASALRILIKAISICSDHLQVTLDPAALGAMEQTIWTMQIPRPARRPFREARLRIILVNFRGDIDAPHWSVHMPDAGSPEGSLAGTGQSGWPSSRS